MAPGARDRYPDAGALAEDLRRWIDGELVRAHHYSPAERLGRWLRRHRGLARLGAAALLALSLVGGLSVQRVRRERRAAQESAAQANARADALVLQQADAALATDPTRTIAWLATYPEAGADRTRV